MGKAFVIIPDRCTGCRCCQLACKDEHVDNDWSPYAKPQPDTGQFWTRVVEKVRGQVPKVKLSYIVRMCMHCRDAVCEKAAPRAVYHRFDGLVVIDPDKAKGRKDLVDVCPYDAIFWNEELQIPQKCTGCAHLVDEGLPPHCVDVCSHEAIRFGDEDELADLIEHAELLVPERSFDGPRVYYINLPKRFLGGVVVDLELDEVVIGAEVVLVNKETGQVRTTNTDEFGDFWFHQIEPAEYTVSVQVEGYLPRTLDASTVQEDRNVGEIDLFADRRVG